ncbi:MAG TPA: DUF3179 domain-containing (seleno)protein [Candidatus Binatia bacterium]|nr:DUF3179 domain-containing (seleno)protein [Candidatus Binatia bacterium]
MRSVIPAVGLTFAAVFFLASATASERGSESLSKPKLFHSLTEPPCSYCSTQNRKNLVRSDDVVLAWLRGAHNGGAFPLRHFIAAPRVINDTYGLFFYDPDGGYVSAFAKDYGYEFQGWRYGVMVVKGKDGTLWSALTGRGIEGPQKGKRLQRLPSMLTQWGYWLMLHPESTAYDLFDGKKYPVAELPTELSREAKESMGKIDTRFHALAPVLGVEAGESQKVFPLDVQQERACYMDTVGKTSVAVFWYGPTRTAVAWNARLGERTLTFHASDSSPETAPFKDDETGTRWTLAGRAVDGPLRGQELQWVESIQCRWYAWAAEYPQTEIHKPVKVAKQ